MTDTEIVDALARGDIRLSDIWLPNYVCPDFQWQDWSGWPTPRGWTRANSFRECCEKLMATLSERRRAQESNGVLPHRD
jgi:hypothetical protein